MSDHTLTYVIKDVFEINLSYMPFIVNGGLFIPTIETYSLNDEVTVNLQLPGKTTPLTFQGRVVWISPKNALHHVLPGIGIQFTGDHTQNIRSQIEAQLDPTIEIGGYTYGITDELKGRK